MDIMAPPAMLDPMPKQEIQSNFKIAREDVEPNEQCLSYHVRKAREDREFS